MISATGNLATDPNSPEPMTTPPADSTAPPPPDDVPDYADLLENELKSLISNRPDTLVSEPSAATTTPGSGEEGKPSEEGNASVRYTQLRAADIHNLGPVVLGCVYPIETSTLLYNLYISTSLHLLAIDQQQ